MKQILSHMFGLWAESRLCFLDSPEQLKQATEVQKKNSGFLASAIEQANALPQLNHKADTSSFTDDEEWRQTWLDENAYLFPKQVTNIISPITFLNNLDIVSRKAYFLQYLQEHFPNSANDLHPLYKYIRETDFKSLTDDTKRKEFLKQVRGFIFMDKRINNVNADAEEKDLRTEPALLPVEELEDDASADLMKKYKNKNGITQIASDDFSRLLESHPAIGPEITQNKDKLLVAVENDPNPIAIALKWNLFENKDLELMTKQFQAKKELQTKVSTEAKDLRNQVEQSLLDNERKSFVENISENFSQLDNWKKLALIGGGIYILYKIWNTPKAERTFLSHYVVLGGAAISAFYLAGGRETVDNTVIGDVLEKGEGFFKNVGSWEKRGDRSLNEILGYPEGSIRDDDIQLYAKLFGDRAGEDLNVEIAAMSFLSDIPMDDVAASFSLLDGARGGELNLKTDSSLNKIVQERFAKSGESNRVIGILSKYNLEMGDGLAHIFYLIGSAEHPEEFKRNEDERKNTQNQQYDELVGSARDSYERLTIRGQELCKTKFKGMKFADIVDKIK